MNGGRHSINFIDYEKAFNNLDRNVLWDLMVNYGIPSKIISLVMNTYEGTNCRILHEGDLTESFSVKSGVRLGCLEIGNCGQTNSY